MIEPTTELHALTVKRPWAYAITHLGKRIENRSWKRAGVPPVCRYRGELFIHAGMGWDAEAAGTIQFEPGLVSHAHRDVIARGWLHPAGVIVARCRAIAHIDPNGRVWLDADETEEDAGILKWIDLRWWHGGYALVLADVVPLAEPVPCKGRLGVWRVPADVAARLRAA